VAIGCHPGPVTPSDDLSLPRRPIFFPVVIATVFLTIIGMTVGFMLGERHRARSRAAGTGQIDTPTPSPEPVGTPQAASGPLCPAETRNTAASLQLPSELHQVLKIVTANGTTVWICEDPAGALYYQGKTGGVDAPLVEKKNGLFLSEVRRFTDRDAYEATAANGNRFVVSREQLEVHFTDGRANQVDRVESAE
jgi:hypothetical protein